MNNQTLRCTFACTGRQRFRGLFGVPMAPKLAPLAPLKGAPGAPAARGGPSEATRAEARKIFDEIDTSGDGQLQKDELYAAMWKLNGSNDPAVILSYGTFIDQQFASADKDLSGSLDFDEFMSICEQRTHPGARTLTHNSRVSLTLSHSCLSRARGRRRLGVPGSAGVGQRQIACRVTGRAFNAHSESDRLAIRRDMTSVHM